ncbi:MAG TPA: hypothetical protein VG820_07535 [Fimbriimonadaceae bacterium]|nr:hypothetical protein [Fimbriimonadaceae bacterium]
MDEPKKSGEKLSKVWTHTLSVTGLLAAIVSIIGFFGIHPPSAPPETPKPPKAAKPETDAKPRPSLETNLSGSPKADSPASAPHPKGIGTLHLDGQFTTGQAMLSTDAIAQATGVSAPLTLKDSKSARLETVTGAMVPVGVEANHLVCVWRKGTQFVHGLRMAAATPHVHLTTSGLDDVDVPTDADGRLNQTLIWPADRMFSTIQFAGPVEIDGHRLDGGISFGDLALPSRFSLDLPKPGEILAAIKGEFSYPAGNEGRFVVVEAVPAGNETPIRWSVALRGGDPTPLRSMEGGTVDKGLYAIRVLCSQSPK